LAAIPDTVDHANDLESNGYVIKVIDMVDFGSGQNYRKVVVQYNPFNEINLTNLLPH